MGDVFGMDDDDENESDENDEVLLRMLIKDLVFGLCWVSFLEVLYYEVGCCYVILDGYCLNDDEFYVFVMENYGKMWCFIWVNFFIFVGFIWVVCEDLVNFNIFYLGCEFFVWILIDWGEFWLSLNMNFFMVVIYEFVIYFIVGEVVVVIYGWSLWILDVFILR